MQDMIPECHKWNVDVLGSLSERQTFLGHCLHSLEQTLLIISLRLLLFIMANHVIRSEKKKIIKTYVTSFAKMLEDCFRFDLGFP